MLDLREQAGYDHLATFDKAEAVGLIADARNAVETAGTHESDDMKIYCCALIAMQSKIQNRWASRRVALGSAVA